MISKKLTLSQVVWLYELHANKEINGTGDYIDLLREHRADFCLLFERLILRNGKSYRLKFTSLQALAFSKLWIDQEVPLNAAGYLVLEILGDLDHAHKQQLLLQA
jgi:hypothetical protein